jgi:carboxyl-terminal processing protease
MGVWVKGLILSTFIVGVLSGSSVDRTTEVPSVESYWYQTGLTEKDLFRFVQDFNCHSSDRYFLACLNSIQQVAIRNGQKLNTKGEFEKLSLEKAIDTNERELLQPWENILQKHSGEEAAIHFQSLWEKLTKDFDEAKKPMMTGIAMNGFLSVFRDPHTYIIPIDYYKQIVASSDYKTSSYGFVITKIGKSFFVKKVIPGSPSDFVGLKRGQQVTKMNDWNLDDMTLNALNEKIRGDKGSEIMMSVSDREGSVFHLTIEKSTQEFSTVHLKFIESDAAPIALLTIDRFSRRSCDKVRNSLTEVRESGARNLILDLRDNPGGQMDEAGCIAGLFVGPEKKIFSVQYLQKNEDRNDTYISEEVRAYKGRTVVLVNRGTASAAEILAGALREYNRAILVGERTFGKGSFQEGDIWSLNSKIALFETKGFYYLPSGFSPQKIGLSPDLSVESANSGSREDGQYWNSLDLSQKESEPVLNGLPFESCQSMGQLAGNPEDPEITKAQQAFNCWGVAQVSGGWR